MTDTLTALLLQLSEGSRPALLWGRVARPHFGPAFERLLAEGVLVERPPAEEWSTCVNCDCGFDARPIQPIGDRIVAACPFDVSADTELEEDDLRDFRIDPERLVVLVAEASGFEPPFESLAPDLWRMGRLASGRAVVVGITAWALDHPGIVLLLKAAAGGAAITVLAPEPGQAIRLRFLEAAIDYAELRAALKPCVCGIDALDRAELEPGPAGPRLVIERRARRAPSMGEVSTCPSSCSDCCCFSPSMRSAVPPPSRSGPSRITSGVPPFTASRRASASRYGPFGRRLRQVPKIKPPRVT